MDRPLIRAAEAVMVATWRGWSCSTGWAPADKGIAALPVAAIAWLSYYEGG